MTTSNRASLLTKTHKVLSKHYKPILPPADRPLMEHLLYACCLENARYEAADETFAKLQQLFFDWNEIRVTTIGELAEVMAPLPDPVAAAHRLKRALQAIFETHYSYDLEFLKKQNIGKSAQELQKFEGVSDFVLAYVTQHGLGGHAIPVDRAALESLLMLGVINQQEANQHRVPGLERAISKSQGIEFASLLHQFAADLLASPSSSSLLAILREINPDARQQLPRRVEKKDGKAAAEKEVAQAATNHAPADKTAQPKKKAAKKTAKKAAKPAKPEPAEANAPSPPPAETEAASPKKTPAKQLSKKKPR